MLNQLVNLTQFASKKERSSKKKLFERNGESSSSKQIFTSLCLTWIVLEKKNSCIFSLVFIVICGIRCERQKHMHCQSHDQVLNNRSRKQKKSFKNHLTKRLFWKKQHNHIKLPCTISALNSRFFENFVIPSKLDANRIIKF